MPSSLLNIFKLVFLALLWLFFLRVLRAVWVSVREPSTTTPAGPAGQPPAAAPITGVRRSEPAASPGSLKVVEPPERRGRVFPLTNEVTIGRGGGCGVALSEDRMVSQLHARIFRGDDGRFFVEDLGSTNGTTLNRSKVSGPVVMKPGDRLQVGSTVLEVGGPVPARSGG